MNFVRKSITNAAVGVAVADNAQALDAFLKPGCAAAIWRRQPSPGIQAWLDALSPKQLPQGRVILRPDAVADTVQQLCDIAKVPSAPERDWLVKDISELGQIFSNLMRVQLLRLRLEAVSDDACRKFHIDAVTARLVCTYRGPGTQYGISTDGHVPRRVFSVPTGAPALFRGALWPEEPPSGLLHRSPPIEGTGETRLFLVFDPVFDPEERA